MSALIEVVTTFSPAGYNQYGRRFIQTFKKHWHGDILLTVYAENMNAPYYQEGERIRIRSYEHFCPDGVEFKAQITPPPPNVAVNRYRFDAKKFSHKSFSLADAARRSRADYLILMDADVETFGHVSPEWLGDIMFPYCFHEEILPDGTRSEPLDIGTVGGFHVACLQRPFYHHTESAFVMHRMCPKVRDLIQSIEDVYTSGHIWSLDGWCDSSVADYVRGRFEKERGLLIRNLTNGVPEDGLTVFEDSILGGKMVHKKGRRKLEAAA